MTATETILGQSGGIVRSKIIGPDLDSVIYRGQLYRVGWGWGYDPQCFSQSWGDARVKHNPIMVLDAHRIG